MQALEKLKATITLKENTTEEVDRTEKPEQKSTMDDTAETKELNRNQMKDKSSVASSSEEESSSDESLSEGEIDTGSG